MDWLSRLTQAVQITPTGNSLEPEAPPEYLEDPMSGMVQSVCCLQTSTVLDAHNEEQPTPKAPPNADNQGLIDWFLTATLPTEAFDLDCARRVLDPAKFFDSLRREIARQQSSPRWRCGATQADLRSLRAAFE